MTGPASRCRPRRRACWPSPSGGRIDRGRTVLDLTPIDPSGSRSLLGWINPFRPELRLRDGTLEEIREKHLHHQDLVRDYGLRQVLLFYEDHLLPALKRLTPSRETWRARYEIGCRAVALRAATEP